MRGSPYSSTDGPGNSNNSLRKCATQYSKYYASKPLCVANVNCRSISNKQAEICALLADQDIDVLCLTETWLRPDIPNSILSIPGYTIFRRDRHDTNLPWSHLGGGGVAVLVRNSLSSKVFPCTSPSVEQLTVQIKVHERKILVTVAYRPPRQPMQDFVDELESIPNIFGSNFCVLAGDFNAKNSAWNSSDQTDRSGKVLQDLFTRFGLDPVNTNCGTRPTSTSNSLLDLIATNAPHLCVDTSTLAPLSDHCPVIATFQSRIVTSKELWPEYRKKVDYSKLRYILTTEPLSERIAGEVSIDYAWKAWNSHFSEAIQRCTTLQRVKHRSQNVLFTPGLHKLRKRCNRLYALSRRHPANVRTRAAYVLCRNHYRQQLRASRRSGIDYQARKISQGCRKGGYVWWKRAKRLCNISCKKQVFPDLMYSNNSVTAQTSEEKAFLFAKHFAEQCTTDAGTKPDSPPSTDSGQSRFSFPRFEITEVFYDLLHLNTHKSTSDRDIIPILKSMADLLSESLTCLFNRSLATATFPADWKCATVLPVFKNKGDPEDVNNYRPISLLPCVARIFEHQLATSFTKYLVDSVVVSPSQFAYMPQKSTNDQLLLLTHKIALYEDSKRRFDCTFLDFTKAFDRVHHPTLLSRLEPLVTASTFQWFQSYLSHRRIKVRVGDSISNMQNINCGVPQGSHLGPVLFLLFINSLPDVIEHSGVYMFADDVVLLHPHDPAITLEDNITNLESDLNKCQQWAEKARGKFSSSKTTVMTNYSLPSGRKVTMSSEEVLVCSSAKHLGLTLNPQLSFDAYFAKICHTFRQRVNLLCYMGKHLSPSTIMLLYKSYVRPVVEYSIPVWYLRLSLKQLSNLDILQARVCRIYLKSKKIKYHPHETKESLNAMCDLQSLHYRRQMLSLIVLFKFIHVHPCYLNDFNITFSESGRRPNKLVYHTHGKLSSSLFLHQTGKLWNCLPPNITALSSLHNFRKAFSLHTYKYKFHCRGIPD